MGAKLNTFFDFFEPYFAEKIKKAELYAESVETVYKKCTKKVISKTSLTNMSKSEKNAYCRQVFANNFFGAFLKTFSTVLKLALNSAFLIPLLLF
jgi:hypothetical protein